MRGMGIRVWRRNAQGRNKWSRVVSQALALDVDYNEEMMMMMMMMMMILYVEKKKSRFDNMI